MKLLPVALFGQDESFEDRQFTLYSRKALRNLAAAAAQTNRHHLVLWLPPVDMGSEGAFLVDAGELVEMLNGEEDSIWMEPIYISSEKVYRTEIRSNGCELLDEELDGTIRVACDAQDNPLTFISGNMLADGGHLWAGTVLK